MYFCSVDLLRQKDKNKKTKIEFFYYIIIGSLKKKDGFSKTYKNLLGLVLHPSCYINLLWMHQKY